MLGRMIKKKRGALVTIDSFLDHSTYDRFRAYAQKNGLDESNALVKVFERGMANYWLQEYKQLKQDYPSMEKLFKEYKQDNEVLRALEQQNEQFKKIFEEKDQRKKTLIHQSKTMR